jgi:hypothetical protein
LLEKLGDKNAAMDCYRKGVALSMRPAGALPAAAQPAELLVPSVTEQTPALTAALSNS